MGKIPRRHRRLGPTLTVLLAGGGVFLGDARDVVAQGDAPCESFELLVSGFFSNDLHIFDGCTGDYIRNLDDAGRINGAQGVVLGSDGNLYVVSENNNRILRYDGKTGAFIDTFIVDDPNTPNSETGGLLSPTAIAFGPDGNLYVAAFNQDRILKFDGDTGAFLEVFVDTQSGGLNGPDAGIMFGPDGHLYVPGFFSNNILRYDGATGDFLGIFASASDGLSNPRVIRLAPSGKSILVTSEGNNSVLRFAFPGGEPLGVFTTAVPSPTGLAFGPEGDVYVTSVDIARVWRFNAADGSFIENFVTPANAGGLNLATFLFFRGPPPVAVPATTSVGAIVLIVLLGVGTIRMPRRYRPSAA